MSNLTDALIAAKLIGAQGGGSGGESDIFIIHTHADYETGSIEMIETFEECESAWDAGKVMFLDNELQEDGYERYYLVHNVTMGLQGIASFDAMAVRIVEGTLVYSEFQLKRDGEVYFFFNRYTLTPAN